MADWVYLITSLALIALISAVSFVLTYCVDALKWHERRSQYFPEIIDVALLSSGAMPRDNIYKKGERFFMHVEGDTDVMMNFDLLTAAYDALLTETNVRKTANITLKSAVAALQRFEEENEPPKIPVLGRIFGI